MLKGFKDFLMRGNVVDLAVAVVIGTAFAAVVTAFVDVIMDLLRSRGYIAEKDGATWFTSPTLGEDREAVLIRSNGIPVPVGDGPRPRPENP